MSDLDWTEFIRIDLGSVTKMVMAIVTLRVLSISPDPIRDVLGTAIKLPKFSGYTTFLMIGGHHEISWAMLLQHRTNLPPDIETIQEFEQLFRVDSLIMEPMVEREKYADRKYDNTNYNLLRYALSTWLFNVLEGDVDEYIETYLKETFPGLVITNGDRLVMFHLLSAAMIRTLVNDLVYEPSGLVEGVVLKPDNCAYAYKYQWDWQEPSPIVRIGGNYHNRLAAGGIYASSLELLRIFQALRAGKILNEISLEALNGVEVDNDKDPIESPYGWDFRSTVGSSIIHLHGGRSEGALNLVALFPNGMLLTWLTNSRDADTGIQWPNWHRDSVQEAWNSVCVSYPRPEVPLGQSVPSYPPPIPPHARLPYTGLGE